MFTLAENLTRMVANGERPVEGIDLVVMTNDEATAIEVAPLLAARLYGRATGPVLHIERCEGEGHIHIVVRDLGPDYGKGSH